MIYVDADDFCEWNACEDVLSSIHERNPAFKITLFTVPGQCSPSTIQLWKGVPWVRLAAHGWFHESSRECAEWSLSHSLRYLMWCEFAGLECGFKAPGWQISDGMYEALRLRHWWVADRHYNDGRRPKALRVYYPSDPGARHYHICGPKVKPQENDIAKAADALAAMTEVEFGFLGE